MDLKEINELIKTREYAVMVVEHPSLYRTVDKSVISYMNGLIKLIDQKLISLLMDEDLKIYLTEDL